MGFAKPIEQYLFGNLLTKMHVFMYLKDIIRGAQVMRKNEKITALYERLSRDDFGKDDDQQRESNSISNQKAMLEEFAARQGFTNIVHFTDDGISGTCFDRPGFLAMMKEVEAGNVEYLCIKDMSRMGRDYLKVGQIMEILRQRGVQIGRAHV